MKTLAPYLAPVVGIIVATSASIAFEGAAKQLAPSDLKALPAFGIKIGVALIGGLLAAKIAKIAEDNVASVVATLYPLEIEAAPSDPEEN